MKIPRSDSYRFWSRTKRNSFFGREGEEDESDEDDEDAEEEGEDAVEDASLSSPLIVVAEDDEDLEPLFFSFFSSGSSLA